jgi:LPXTG-motif cell wall-anchored protein
MSESLGKRKWRWGIALIIGLAVLLVAVSAAMAAPSADPEAGRTLYTSKFCIRCHGENGVGGFGPPLAATTRTVDQVVNKVRNSTGRMPRFNANQVSDTEISDIVDFLKTLQRPASPGAPAFSVQPGDPPEQVLFIDKGCVNCHGRPPSVAGTQLDAAGEIQQVRTPRGRMGAYIPDQISDAEITQINTWLRSLPAPAPKPQPSQATPTPAPAKPGTTATVVSAAPKAQATTTPAAAALPRTGEGSSTLLQLGVIALVMFLLGGGLWMLRLRRMQG